MPRANPMRGEAELGDHKLIVNFNGWCVAEASTGQKMKDLLRAATSEDGLDFRTLRALTRAFLDVDMTYDEVGDFIDRIGLEETLTALGTAMAGFFAEPKEEKERNPPKAA